MTYEFCKRLKDAGFPQRHNRYAKYYLNPDLVIDFETAHDVFNSNRQSNDVREEVDFTLSLVYIPTLEDLMGQAAYEQTWLVFANEWLKNNENQTQNNELPPTEAQPTN